MFDVRRLRLLRELHLRGTISEVARALKYTPSAVSQQLSLLEREVGVQVLRKTGRGLVLTAAGETLVAHTHNILNLLETAEADIASIDQVIRGKVRIAAFQSALLALIPRALTIMANEYPDVRVELVQREPSEALSATWVRDFDMVIAEDYPGHESPHRENLRRIDLTSDAIRLVCPPGFVNGRKISTAADVQEMPWVMEPPGAASRHFAEQMCRVSGFEPDVRFETADLQAQIKLIESGHAVAFIPDLMWANATTTCHVVTVQDSPRRKVFVAVRESGEHHPGVKSVLDALGRTAQTVSRSPYDRENSDALKI